MTGASGAMGPLQPVNAYVIQRTPNSRVVGPASGTGVAVTS